MKLFTEEQETKLRAANIFETAEIFKFSANLWQGVEDAKKDDGKVSLKEKAAILWDSSRTIDDAFQGWRDAIKEVKAIHPEQMEMLGDCIFPFHGTKFQRIRMNALIGWMVATVNLERAFTDSPKADIVPENEE